MELRPLRIGVLVAKILVQGFERMRIFENAWIATSRRGKNGSWFHAAHTISHR
jgi:hypothetical protein